MTRQTFASRWLRQRHADDEAGFTLLELVLACGVLALVLASLAYTGTMAFADAAISRHRTSAASLANEALEQVRALPYNKVALGLSTTDIATGADPAITSSGGVYRFDGERIPNGNNEAIAPLVPHQATRTLDDMDFTVSVYVTYLGDDITSRALRVTVRVSWESPLRAGVQKFVDAQTVVYSPSGGTGGCGSNATHPFAAPCQPFLYSNTSSGEGAISFSAFAGTAIEGVDLAEATLYLPTQDTNMAIEQVQTASATARTSGVRLRQSSDGSTQSSGRSLADAATDSDPSQPKPAHDSSSAGPQASAVIQLSGSGNSIQLTSAAGDTATARATMAAGGTNTCPNSANPPVNQTDLQPCANATSVQGGAMTAQLNLNSLGSAVLASIGTAATSSAGFSNRDITPQATSCTTTSDDGCIHASQRSSVGTVAIGGLPSVLQSLAPLGFDYLLKLTGFSRTVTAEAGYGNADPSVTNGGTIQYWNGFGYTSVAVASGASATIPIANVVVTNGLTSTTIGMTAVVRSGGTTSGPCASPCANAEARAESPIVGDIRYTVVVGGTTVVDLNIHIDLGTLLARAEYQPGA
jgi:type II secretory pathway pseudopilin PulG